MLSFEDKGNFVIDNIKFSILMKYNIKAIYKLYMYFCKRFPKLLNQFYKYSLIGGKTMTKQLLISQHEIEQLITMKEVVDICDRTFQDMGKERTVTPAKIVLDLGEGGGYPNYEGFMNAMPSYVGW